MNRFSEILRVCRMRAAEGNLGTWRQLGEMVILRMLRGVGPGYYHTAGFWRRDLGWSDKTGQLSAGEYRRLVARLNPLQYRKLSQNKIPEKAILTLFGIPTPRFLGRLQAQIGADFAGRPLRTPEDLERLIQDCATARMVFKHPEGWGGKGVHVPTIERSSTMFREPGTSEAVGVYEYCNATLELAHGGDWIVEEYFSQHPVLMSLNPGSVNTVRIWVLDRGPAGHQVLTAYLRIGRANMFVDNASSGGIVAAIDLESGQLHAGQDAHAEHKCYPHHPDHEARIEGVMLPHWQLVREIAERAVSVFPGVRFAGLDVAIGESGPSVLELNVSPDREGAAFTGFRNRSMLEE